MKDLNQFPAWANKALGGMTADEQLKYKIIQAAEHGTGSVHRPPKWSYAIGTCLAAAVIIAGGIGFNSSNQPVQAKTESMIVSTRAGVNDSEKLESFADEAFAPNGLVQQSDSMQTVDGLWAVTEDNSIPIIHCNERYYRMLIKPIDVASNLLGNEISKIDSFTSDPALLTSKSTYSNIVHVDTPVYAIPGMAETLVAAQVDGHMRLFQRIGYNGNALVGNEKLTDVLQIAGRVVSIESSQGFSINAKEDINSLIDLLLTQSVYESSASSSYSSYLVLTLDNGLSLQLDYGDDSFSSCGTWSNPEFFELLSQLV